MSRKKDEDAAAAAELFFDKAIARMEQYVNNSEREQMDIDEVEECSLGLEY